MMSSPKIPPGTNRMDGGEQGQALVELSLIVVLCIIIGLGIFEAGIVYHNVSVMNRGVARAANYAAHGAPMSRIKQSVVSEARNLMGSAMISQAIDTRGVGVAIYNPESGRKIAPTKFSEEFRPKERWVAEYMFWAQGYEVRVELIYKIAWNLPFIYTYYIELPIVASHTILASNDIDRDGMVDHLEQAYVEFAMHQEAGDTDWLHPVHRDGYGLIDTDPGADVDGDDVSGDTNPFDFNNDFTEDKFDSGTGNQMRFNPVMGPRSWPHEP